jgi:hypothetical protein
MQSAPSSIACTRPPAELHTGIDECLKPEPPPKRHRQHDPGVHDDTLVIEADRESVRRVVHHEGDLLMQDPQPLARPVLPAQEVISLRSPDRPRRPERWIEA